MEGGTHQRALDEPSVGDRGGQVRGVESRKARP